MSVSESGGLDDACKWLRARGGIAISLRAGAGRIVRGRPASELTSWDEAGDDGGEGEGVDVGDVFTEMDVDARGGVDVRCCWLARRGLRVVGWVCGLVFGARRGVSMTISTSSSESSCPRSSEGSPPRATRCCFRGGLVSVYRCCLFLFLRGDTRGITAE